MVAMATEQGTLFNARTYRGQKPLVCSVKPVTAQQTVVQTLPAYRLYLSENRDSEYTPDNYVGDIKLLGRYTGHRAVSELQATDLQQWLDSLKATMAKTTISRKASAMANYFQWLTNVAKVLESNPAEGMQGSRVTSPTPDLLYDSECDQLLRANGSDSRTYLLILLLLETGMKKAELLALNVSDFDVSDRWQPVVRIRHTGKKVAKDRKIKLPKHIADVLDDYVQRYGISDRLFPVTERFINTLLADATMRAHLTKRATASMLRDMCVINGVKKEGETLETMFKKIGLSENSYDDARKKYGRLMSEAL